ncbi:NAD-dependent epimerase/dehydratase family protein [Umezawaea sp.]|uniref:NAD-dependent epimerase/dehydratase family protein n=1 Tax=Umezawaea sp. TaxID=1955258 RepID=UPI002ED191AF
MRVLVTGASGFIGGAVVARLVAAGHAVRALAHEADVPAGVESARADLRDRDSLVRAADGVDAVVHLAAVARVRESFERPLHHYEVNVGGTVNLLSALPEGSRVVFVSTGTVYGAPLSQPIPEDCPRAPANPYAASKAAAEDAVAWTARSGRIGATTLRLFNAAGGDDRDGTRVITRAVDAAAGGTPLTVFGDGSAVRDFVHVEDVATAAALALERTAVGSHDVFNVGATAASVRDVVASVERVTGRPVPLVRAPANDGEVAELRADTRRLRRVLGWEPERSALDDLVRDQWVRRA